MYAILRTAKLKSLGNIAGSLAHAHRTRETLNADPARSAANQHSHDTPAQALAALKERLPEKRRSDAVLGVEYMIGASPEWFELKTQDQQNAYLQDALTWLREKHGAENVVAWSVHQDEKTPHLSAIVVPLVDGKLNAKAFTGGRARLSQMQTDFAKVVGQRHGLQRGIEGSKAKHQTIKQHYAQIQQVGELPEFQAEDVEPKKFKRGLLGKLGMTTHEEVPEAVASRLTDQVRAAVSPMAAQAAVAGQERRRAKEMALTASSATRELKTSQEALNRLVGGLEVGDLSKLQRYANELRRDRALENERKRRVEALPRLLRLAGAVVTFAQHAIAAIAKAAGNWRDVDWRTVEAAAVRESVQEHRQPPSRAYEAVLKHSPGQAHITAREVEAQVARVKQTKDPEHEARFANEPPIRQKQSRGMSR